MGISSDAQDNDLGYSSLSIHHALQGFCIISEMDQYLACGLREHLQIFLDVVGVVGTHEWERFHSFAFILRLGVFDDIVNLLSRMDRNARILQLLSRKHDKTIYLIIIRFLRDRLLDDQALTVGLSILQYQAIFEKKIQNLGDL